MKPVHFFLLAAACCGAAACGQRAGLKPAGGQPLPIKPLLAKVTPTPAQLLTAPPNARPARVDELVKRSEPRRPDRFDLPPSDGAEAPAIAASDEPASDEQTGVSTPQ